MADVRDSPATTGGLAQDEVEPPPPGPRPPSDGVVPWLRWTWRQLTSMRTALVLLFLLALGSVPGSVLPQRPRSPGDVQNYVDQHPQLAPILDKLWFFNVFASPWFAAIYLLLAVSLVGCIVPRSSRHLRALRARPPRAPRNLARLPVSARWHTEASPAEALEATRSVLAAKRFRVDTTATTVSAEKGFLKETGNLFFHIALLGMLLAVAAGQLFGYHGKVMVTEGEGFANVRPSYITFDPGRFIGPTDMKPFTVKLDDFHATYQRAGAQRGMPQSFSATVHYRASPGSPWQRKTIEVNHPLVIGGAKIYLLGHGYAPTFTVRDGGGDVAFKGPVKFLPRNKGGSTSDGVVKVPDARPTQLAFAGFFTPTTAPSKNGPTSVFPAPLNPAVTLLAYKGQLAVSSGVPKNVYQLDTTGLERVKADQLTPGQTMTLPNGQGSITFSGFKEWAGLKITDDPSKKWALAAAAFILAGLLLTLWVRRRRVWVRVSREYEEDDGDGEPDGAADDGGGDRGGPNERGDNGPGGGSTVVEVGGLTRGAARGFEEEFAGIADTMRSRASRTRPEGSAGSTSES